MAFHYSAKEFIKVYRKLLDWEWYTDINTKTLFIHCLLRANWKAGIWHGVQYDAGEFITSLPSISRETGLTIQQARSALQRLESTGEITSRTTGKVTDRATGKTTDKNLNKCRIITVNNWNMYQGDNSQNNSQSNSQDNRQSNRQTRKQPTGNQQATAQATNSRYKNIKNIEDKKEKEINKEKDFSEPSDEEKLAWWNSIEDETPEKWRQG